MGGVAGSWPTERTGDASSTNALDSNRLKKLDAFMVFSSPRFGPPQTRRRSFYRQLIVIFCSIPKTGKVYTIFAILPMSHSLPEESFFYREVRSSSTQAQDPRIENSSLNPCDSGGISGCAAGSTAGG